jgi:predicted nucleic acid-binding protein
VEDTCEAGALIETRFMSARSFFDTNILVYADDDDTPKKQRVGRDLWDEHRRAGTGVVSMQVLQEYFVTVTQKLGFDPRKARRKVEIRSPRLTSLLLRSAISSLPSTSTVYMGLHFGMR